MNRPPLRILLVEDNAGDARLLREMLSKESAGSFELTHVLLLSEALAHLGTREVDIVIMDIGLPDEHGIDTVRRARAAAPTVPVIVLTGLEDEALAAEAIKSGAVDYLIKGQIENRALPRALRHAIESYRMNVEAERARQREIQFKDEFLSHVSHELRTPLNAIYQFVSILADGLAGDIEDEQQHYLQIVLRNVKQLKSMIDDLLEVTRVQGGKLVIDTQRTEVADAVRYVANTLRATATAKDVSFFTTLEQRLPAVCADPLRLRQVLIILVDNAIKYTSPGGHVRIEAGVSSDDPGFLLLRVCDSGCGLAADMSERIFERLYQTPQAQLSGRHGLGLGLYICKELVTRQGGQISVQSVEGHGSVFSVTVPVFSLSRLLSTALGRQTPQEAPMMLLVAELGSRSGWLSDEERSRHLSWARQFLGRCLHPDVDVLLPKMGESGACELFFIIAMTDARGGEAIASRIRENDASREYLAEAGLTLSVDCRPLAGFVRGSRECRSSSVARTADEIQIHINEELSSRLVISEHQENTHHR